MTSYLGDKVSIDMYIYAYLYTQSHVSVSPPRLLSLPSRIVDAASPTGRFPIVEARGRIDKARFTAIFAQPRCPNSIVGDCMPPGCHVLLLQRDGVWTTTVCSPTILYLLSLVWKFWSHIPIIF